MKFINFYGVSIENLILTSERVEGIILACVVAPPDNVAFVSESNLKSPPLKLFITTKNEDELFANLSPIPSWWSGEDTTVLNELLLIDSLLTKIVDAVVEPL